jgi:hypothetical protein
MPLKAQVEGRRFTWRALVICVALASLVITLAGRFPTPSAQETSVVQSRGPIVKIQHRDKDAVSWASPAPRFLLLWEPAPIPEISWQDDAIPVLHLDFSLFDRPPPIS